LRIKSLELNGFKSFVDKTALRFQPGITAVVGPNGCGKSNVVDAMRWAMGEQSPRRLRGKGMEDVIFSGSEGRSPVGMAEVTLTFDNSGGDGPPTMSEYSEIQITRRLYRSGESEYLLNKTACRLRDVQDFFRDSGIGTRGYTIVEQGRIAEIVSAKAEERRILIEEAAGIGKYKARRREAESKIASTEQNLLRVTDILTEIRRQISSIERQARKAARYKRLRETLRILELSIALEDRQELSAAIQAARGRRSGLADELTALETQLAERELSIEQRRIELAECEKVLSQGSEVLLALRSEIKEAEGSIAFGRRERETLAEIATTRRGEIERLAEQLATQHSEAEQAREELEAVERAVESEREGVTQAEAAASEARDRHAEAERQREEASAALVEVLTHIARAEDRLASIADRVAAIDQRMRSADADLEVGQSEASRFDREQESLEEGLRNLLAERDRFMGLLKDALEKHRLAVESAKVAGEALRSVREERETRRARLGSLREVIARHDDLGEGARHLLGEPAAAQSFGLRGLVRDGIEVDAEIERAVEAVLAERAEALIVEEAAGAVSAIQALRQARAGRGLFVTLPSPEPEPQGFVPLGQPLLERVRPRPGFEDLARSLLGGVNLVADLREVLTVYGGGRLPASFVTPEGDLLGRDGIIAGGSAPNAGGGHLALSREVRELATEVDALDARVVSAEARHGQAEAHLAQASDELENLRNRHHTAALAVANHEKDLERTRERVKAIGEVQEGRAAERSGILAENESLAAESARLEQLLSAARQDRASRQRDLDALVLRLGSLGREVSRLETAAAEARIEHAGREEKCSRLRQAFERATGAAEESARWIARREEEIAAAEARREELATRIAEAEVSLEANLAKEEAARATTEEKRDAFERVAADVNELEEQARGLRNDIGTRREAVGKADLAVQETELRLGHLEDGVREKWEVELSGWELPPLDPSAETPAEAEADAAAEGEEPLSGDAVAGTADPAAAAGASPDSESDDDAEEPARDEAREARANAELARLPREERTRHHAEVKRKLGALGEVNLAAIEEHEALAERFRFLGEQKADLDETLESLRDAIQRINRTSRRRFRETFEQISKHFSENFPRLFRGGKASLSLTDAEDILEAGIEIMAQPPGKRLQNVNLLSGGEKTLTALALLIAVFQVRPAPFFLLDEVDAALDDANVGRFNEIVAELAATSQFVLITHNKRTIEVADLLYGVTMERKGVSTLVSVELH